MLTDWGVHLIDIVQWAMDTDAPLAVTSRGDKYFMKDNRDTPDASETTIEYPGFLCTYSDCDTNSHGIDGHGYGIQFYGTNGTLYLDRSGYHVKPQIKRDGLESYEAMGDIRSDGSDQHLPHVQNFIDCVKSRELPTSDIEIGHRSTSTPLLAKISYITKERVEWDAENERITNSQKANALVKREYRKPWVLPDKV
jgi:predicted dehydrogenase